MHLRKNKHRARKTKRLIKESESEMAKNEEER